MNVISLWFSLSLMSCSEPKEEDIRISHQNESSDTENHSDSMDTTEPSDTAEVSDTAEASDTAVDLRPLLDEGIDIGNGFQLDFVLIPAGADPLGRYTLTRDIYLMTTEVTQGMFEQLMGYACMTGHTDDPGQGDAYPAYRVSWHMAADFANQVTQLFNAAHGLSLQTCYSCTGSGPDIRCTALENPYQCTGVVLPTDAEWEYAARSGTTKDVWTGEGAQLGGAYDGNGFGCAGDVTLQDGVNNPLIGDYAWFCGNSSSSPQEVGQKLPNGFGLYDMHGNVREWTADWYQCVFPQSSVDPWCEVEGPYRVSRSGNYYLGPHYMQAAYRFEDGQDVRSSGIGMRVGIHP